MRLAHQVADGTGLAARLVLHAFAEVQQAVGGAAIAHLVVQAGQYHVVVLAQAAVGIDQVLGHDKQRDALHARDQLAVRAGDLGQHQVHNIVGQLMLAGRDPHLVAAQAVLLAQRRFAVVVGARGDVRQRRAGLRLGQAHGAEEAPFHLRLDEGLHLRRRAVREQQVGVADGQERIGTGADVGALEVGEAGLLHHHRQLHAADVVVLPGRHQAGLAEGLQRGLDLGDDGDGLAVEMRLVLVALLVVRREQVGGDLLAGIERGVEGLAGMVGVARNTGQPFDLEPFVQHEVQVTAGKDQRHGRKRLPD